MISQEHEEVQRYIDEDENARGRTAKFGGSIIVPTKSSPEQRVSNIDDKYLIQSNSYDDRSFQPKEKVGTLFKYSEIGSESPQLKEYNYPMSYSHTPKFDIPRKEFNVEDSYERIKADIRKQVLGTVLGAIDKEFVDKLEVELDKIINQAKKEVEENTNIIKREIDNKAASRLKSLQKQIEEKYKREVDKFKMEYLK